MKERATMNKIATIAGLAVAATAMSASADVLLSIDLSVVDQITVNATSGNASASASASVFTGFLMADFFGDATVNPTIADGVGNLTSANNASDFGPSIFSGASSVGFNIWAFSPDTNFSVTGGAVAFTGSATWNVDSAVYANALAGALSGDIYVGADTDDDIPTSTNVGTWEVVPAPSSMALLGLGGLVAGRRRRA